METTRDLAFYAKHGHRREVRVFNAVANDHLCLVHERRLTNVEDQNELLVKIAYDLNKENDVMHHELEKAEHKITRLQVANAELKFLNEKLQSQRAAMCAASIRVKEANEEFQAVAAETFASSLAPVAEYPALAERPHNPMPW